jgi:AmmeMemoRadiSam system protein B/AmmeMemoRadiSam system protein A
MNIHWRLLPVLALAVIAAGACRPRKESAMPATKPATVREAAVAGLFYPGEPQQLSRQLDSLLANAHPEAIGDLKAVICPHAGYQFSGQTAAFAYKLLAGRDIKTVILLAPSHYALFHGAFVTDRDLYRTPLGDVKVSAQAAQLAIIPPFTSQPRAQVQRPDWWTQSPAAKSLSGADTPETWEHSGEVQVPFLQKVLPKAELVPVVFGQLNPADIAKALADRLDDQTVIVASSDLSHYHPYAEARSLDARCINDILALKADLSPESACGAGPIGAVIELARMKGWKPKLLDYRNSGDATGNTNTTVVGYAAIAFLATGDQRFTAIERRQLLDLARTGLTAAVNGQSLPVLDAAQWPAKFREKTGCFVTLTKHGQLRGCIGHIMPYQPLYQAIVSNAKSAALDDGRFPPVTPAELKEIEIEVSVLTVPEPLAFKNPDDLLAKLRPHKDGVVLQVQGSGSTFLPQVWAQIPDKVEFLNQLAQKAGRAADAWRQAGTQVHTYQVEACRELEP